MKKLLKDLREYLTGNAPLAIRAEQLIRRIDYHTEELSKAPELCPNYSEGTDGVHQVLIGKCLSDGQLSKAPETTTGDWINATDKLPKPDVNVIVPGGIAYINEEGAWFSITGIPYPGRVLMWRDPIWWMPLPKQPPPQGTDSGEVKE